LLGEPGLYSGGSWRADTVRRSNVYRRLVRQKLLFILCLITLALVFVSMLLKNDEASQWLLRFLTIAYLSFYLSGLHIFTDVARNVDEPAVGAVRRNGRISTQDYKAVYQRRLTPSRFFLPRREWRLCSLLVCATSLHYRCQSEKKIRLHSKKIYIFFASF